MQENINQIILPKDMEEQQNNISSIAEASLDVGLDASLNIGETITELANEEVVGTAFEGICEIIGGIFSGLSS